MTPRVFVADTLGGQLSTFWLTVFFCFFLWFSFICFFMQCSLPQRSWKCELTWTRSTWRGIPHPITRWRPDTSSPTARWTPANQPRPTQSGCVRRPGTISSRGWVSSGDPSQVSKKHKSHLSTFVSETSLLFTAWLKRQDKLSRSMICSSFVGLYLSRIYRLFDGFFFKRCT